jgi:hypothetical protein
VAHQTLINLILIFNYFLGLVSHQGLRMTKSKKGLQNTDLDVIF